MPQSMGQMQQDLDKLRSLEHKIRRGHENRSRPVYENKQILRRLRLYLQCDPRPAVPEEDGVSRFVVDVERFTEDDRESLSNAAINVLFHILPPQKFFFGRSFQ